MSALHHSAAAAKKLLPVAVIYINKRSKEEINHFCSLKDSSIFNLEFRV